MSLSRTSCILLLGAALWAGAASAMRASTPATELDAVASQIAGHEISVRCYANDGVDEDSNSGAWGYVRDLDGSTLYIDPDVCAGALALKHGEFAPLIQMAAGALFLTHEAYHLKTALPFLRRGSEAQTECRAIKRVPQTLRDLGASDSLADAILPWAIALHFKESTFKNWYTGESYNYPSCKVPIFSDFWS